MRSRLAQRPAGAPAGPGSALESKMECLEAQVGRTQRAPPRPGMPRPHSPQNRSHHKRNNAPPPAALHFSPQRSEIKGDGVARCFCCGLDWTRAMPCECVCLCGWVAWVCGGTSLCRSPECGEGALHTSRAMRGGVGGTGAVGRYELCDCASVLSCESLPRYPLPLTQFPFSSALP